MQPRGLGPVDGTQERHKLSVSDRGDPTPSKEVLRQPGTWEGLDLNLSSPTPWLCIWGKPLTLSEPTRAFPPGGAVSNEAVLVKHKVGSWQIVTLHPYVLQGASGSRWATGDLYSKN